MTWECGWADILMDSKIATKGIERNRKGPGDQEKPFVCEA